MQMEPSVRVCIQTLLYILATAVIN